MATLAEKQSELSKAKEALAAARFAVSYGQGDRSVSRARLPEIEAHVARLAAEVRALEDAARGAPSPGVVGVKWA